MDEIKKDGVTLADIRSKFKLYYTADIDLFTSSKAIRFKGSATDFLSIASSLGVVVIYIGDNGSKLPDNNTLSEKFGFLRDGYMHVFDSSAESNNAEEQQEKQPSSGNVGTLDRIKQNPDEESRNMAMWVKSNLNYMSPDSFNLQYFFSKYWQRLGIDRLATLNSGDRAIIEEIEKMATARIKSSK
jgi:hypothetical protein